MILPGRELTDHTSLDFTGQFDAPVHDPTLCDKLIAAIQAYYDGQRVNFNSIALDACISATARTPFAARVMRCVQTIEYGRVATYGQVACMVGAPRAARAVGVVMKNNPLPLIVPCHRVVASKGPGGFNGGVDLKCRMLQLEGAATLQDTVPTGRQMT